jgi:hypothetical protein
MPAMAKASASRSLENLIFALVGCWLGSIEDGGVIWVWSTAINNSFVVSPGRARVRAYQSGAVHYAPVASPKRKR